MSLKLHEEWSILHVKLVWSIMQTGKTMSNQSNISIELIQVITFDHAFWQPRPCKFEVRTSILYTSWSYQRETWEELCRPFSCYHRNRPYTIASTSIFSLRTMWLFFERLLVRFYPVDFDGNRKKAGMALHRFLSVQSHDLNNIY